MNVAQYRQGAVQALKEGDVQGAIERLRSAINLEPDNVDLHHELAECQWANYEFGEALKSYGDACRVASHIATTCSLAAKKLFSIARFHEAAQWLERAVTQAPQDVALLTRLGEVYDRCNKVPEAEQFANEALSVAPQNVRAVRLMAHIERRRGRFDDARRRLVAHLNDHPGPEDWRLRYELAAVLDRLGEFDAAMQELLTAKEQLRPQAVADLAQAQSIIQRQREVAQLLTRADFEGWRASRPSHWPQRSIAFLCGHPRSGTTLLEQIIAAHAGAVTTDETGVLIREFVEPILRQPASAAESIAGLRAFDADQIAAGRAAYLRFTEAHVGEAIGQRWLVDKDPSLTPDLPLPLRLFPEGRVIFPLRDPRDVCISYFLTLIPLAASSAAALDLGSTCESCAHSLELWTHWKNTLPVPLLVTRYVALVSDVERETRRVLEFLGLPWNENFLTFHERSRTRGIRTPTYADVAEPIYERAVGRWKNYEKYLAPHLDVLRPHLRAFGYE
jgi:Flp pilus assembly protein TadD